MFKKTHEQLAVAEQMRRVAEQKKIDEEFAKSPAGQARQAWNQGADSFQISLSLSESRG